MSMVTVVAARTQRLGSADSRSHPSMMIVRKATSAGGNAASCLAVLTLSCTRRRRLETRPIGFFANQALGH